MNEPNPIGRGGRVLRLDLPTWYVNFRLNALAEEVAGIYLVEAIAADWEPRS